MGSRTPQPAETSAAGGVGTPVRPRRAWPRIALLGLLIAVPVAIKYGRHHVFPKRFVVVEPGRLYRSGQCEAGPFRRMIREHGIRTILVLTNNEPGSPDQVQEESIAREAGVRLIRVGMPGNGCADFDLLDQAAAVLADSSLYPLLVHCYAGVNRTGATYAAWRMRHEGWDVEQAIAEGDGYGLSIRRNPLLMDHLRRYYAERIRRGGQTQAERPAAQFEPGTLRESLISSHTSNEQSADGRSWTPAGAGHTASEPAVTPRK